MKRNWLATALLLLAPAIALANMPSVEHTISTAIDNGKYLDAVKVATKALKEKTLSPADHANILAQRAYALIWLSRPREAENDLAAALDVAPDKDTRTAVIATAEHGYSSRADDFDTQQKWAESIKYNTLALKYDFYSADLYEARATAFMLNLQLDAAIDDFNAAINLTEGSPQKSDSSRYLGRGNAYEMQGDFRRAIFDYDRAQKLDPSDDVVLSYRGRAYALLGDYPSARRDFTKILSLSPHDSSTLLWLHIVHMRTGEHDSEWLRKNIVHARIKRWPGPALLYFAGKLTAHDMVEIALNSAETKRARQQCDGWFYLAEEALSRKETTRAASLLSKTVRGCNPVDYEWVAARTELSHLQDKSN